MRTKKNSNSVNGCELSKKEKVLLFTKEGVKCYSSEKLFLETVRIRKEFNKKKEEQNG